MYDSSMKTATYPLAMPKDLLNEVRTVAKATGLSLADAMRQSMRLGLPKLREQLCANRLTPLTPQECRQCWGTPDPEFDALEAAMAKPAKHPVPGAD
jgi:hypothetical protein